MPAKKFVPPRPEPPSGDGTEPPSTGPQPRRQRLTYSQLSLRPAHPAGLQRLPYDATLISANEFAAAKHAFRITGSVAAASDSSPEKSFATTTMQRWLSNAGERFPLTKGPLSEKQIMTALEAYRRCWNSHPVEARRGAIHAAHQAIGGEPTITKENLRRYFFDGQLSGLGKAMLEQEMLDAWLARRG